MTYTPIYRRQWPPKPKTPVEIVKSLGDDVNEFSRWSLGILGGRNPFSTYAYLAASMYGFGFSGAWLAGAGARGGHHAGRFAVTQFLRGTAASFYATSGQAFWSVVIPYYVGRNVAYAIDPHKGEARFHQAILNPLATIPKTHGHIMTIGRVVAEHKYRAQISGGGGGGF